MNILRGVFEKTGQIARDTSVLLEDIPHPACMPFALAAFAGITLTAFGTFLATETGGAILGEIRRRRRLHEPHPESPSLRGTPRDSEIAADCAEKPRTLLVRLRIGSRLADLEPTLDSGAHYDEPETGSRRIASRGRGMKGWLEDHRIKVNYSTLMKYKKLANRLRQLLELDGRIPLEWLLPGESPDRFLPTGLRAQYATARRRLARLFQGHPNFSRLRKHVEGALGIPQLLTVRHNPRRAKQVAKNQRRLAKQKPIHCESVVLGNRCIRLEESVAETTKREIILFLRTPNLPPKLDRLRNRAIEWLRSALSDVRA